MSLFLNGNVKQDTKYHQLRPNSTINRFLTGVVNSLSLHHWKISVIHFPMGTITHLTLQSKAADLYSRARQLSPAPAVLVLESAGEAGQRPRLSPT